MITNTGFVLVRESFDYRHDYAIVAFSDSREELEKYPVEPGANYIFPVTSDIKLAFGRKLKNKWKLPKS